MYLLSTNLVNGYHDTGGAEKKARSRSFRLRRRTKKEADSSPQNQERTEVRGNREEMSEYDTNQPRRKTIYCLLWAV